MFKPNYHEPLTVTVRDAKRISGLGRTIIYELINQGKLESTTVGRRRLIIFASLTKLLTQPNSAV